MSLTKIQSALEKTFDRQRVVFWYDESAEWWPEFDGLQLPGVEKVTVQNNEFAVKHRIVREARQQKFLLYFRGQPRPPDAQNWMLDQLLAYGGKPFSPGRAALACIEAGLSEEFIPLAEQHQEFFRSNERATKLKELARQEDTERDVRLKMLAIICRTEPTVESVLLALLTSDSTREKTAARKEADKLRKTLRECQEWEHDVLLPLAQQRVELDLDDGVKVNYLKFGAAVAPIPGLAGKEDE